MHVSIIRRVLDTIAPRYCSVCGRRLGLEEDLFCSPCVMRLPLTDFLNNPYDNDMAKVFWGRIKHFEKAYALMQHLPKSNSAQPLYQLKYHDKPFVGIEFGIIMGRLMSRVLFFDDIDFIIPMPLTSMRRSSRGYNQCEMIAEGLSEVSHVPVAKHMVVRNVFESSQIHKGRWGRLENVENVFECRHADKIEGKHLLIVDDVVTTGATICSLVSEIQKLVNVKISVASISFAGRRYTVTKNV